MKKIVLGYDDTDASQRALERAAQLAKAFDAELFVTSVSRVMYGAGRSAGPIDPTDPPAKHAEELAHAREYLEGQGVSAEYQPAVGDPADAIVELARERRADLIVVGTREPSIVGRLLGQSVSESVSHRAHCDVLIVHPEPPWTKSS
jgi:nucleotide-binding universal stress UspA family protein